MTCTDGCQLHRRRYRRQRQHPVAPTISKVGLTDLTLRKSRHLAWRLFSAATGPEAPVYCNRTSTTSARPRADASLQVEPVAHFSACEKRAGTVNQHYRKSGFSVFHESARLRPSRSWPLIAVAALAQQSGIKRTPLQTVDFPAGLQCGERHRGDFRGGWCRPPYPSGCREHLRDGRRGRHQGRWPAGPDSKGRRILSDSIRRAP